MSETESMRITGGTARGIPLKIPAGSASRPATDRMREALFSSLGDVAGLRFVDLFAGSGAYGLEAWSRGAAGGVSVERNRKAAAALAANTRSVARSLDRSEKEIRVVCTDVLRWRPAETGFADLVFVDPPYESIREIAPAIFERVREWLAPGGRLIFEMPGDCELQADKWRVIRRIGRGRREPTCAIYTCQG